jgi:flagellar biosynthesis protein FlhF
MASLSRRTDVRIHIVIDAGQSVEQIHRVFDAYRDVRPDRIVVTKVDQIRSLGPLLGVLGEVGIPVSYLCAGQRVPEDIEVASARFLAESVLGENR